MIIQCDFDGTIISNNLSTMLRENFAHGNWRKINSDYLHRQLTVERSNQLQFAFIREPKEKLQEFARRHIELRPGFMEFARYCRDTDTPLVIVSSGLDFYIEPVLAQIGLSELEWHCAQTLFSKDGIIVAYYDPEGNSTDEGFKEKYLAWLKKRDRNVIYIGNGLSDLEAARHADHVFATGHLLRLLRAESVPATAFTDFYDIQRQLEHKV